MDKYIQWTHLIRDELLESLTADQQELVESDVRSMGESAWLSWIHEHIEEVFEYVEATAKERLRRKAWKDNPGHHLRIALAASLILPRAATMIEESIGVAYPGSSYRLHAASACLAWHRIYFAPCPLWPFDDDGTFFGFDR